MRTKRLLALLMAVCMLSTVLAACAQDAPAPSSDAPSSPSSTSPEADTAAPDDAEQITLSFWATNSTVPPGDQLLPQDQWYVTGAVERFKEQHPNFNVEITLQDDAVIPQLLRAAYMAGNAPDIAGIWSGLQTLQLSDILLPVDDYINDDVKNHLLGWASVSEDFNPDNPSYAIPNPGQLISFIFYNKSLVAKAGLDFENSPPRTISEYFDSMDVLSKSGMLPTMTYEDTRAPALIWFMVFYWWYQQTGTEGILSSGTGETKFADDQGLLNALDTYSQMYEKGFVNQDALSADDFVSRFMRGEAAMYLSGVWQVDELQEALGDDLGVMLPPNMEGVPLVVTDGLLGGPGEAWSVLESTKHPQLAVDFVCFLASRDEYLKQYEKYRALPNRNDIKPEDLNITDPVFSKLFNFAAENPVVFWVSNILEPNALQEVIRRAGDVFVGNIDPIELAEAMDQQVALN